jgi:hypothetical protein
LPIKAFGKYKKEKRQRKESLKEKLSAVFIDPAGGMPQAGSHDLTIKTL